ncbi:MAG: choice-of-anchor D domain-containing protein [Ignavibacteria bacterium]|nr:choice-of-anchor D domain-containing protein [Ignavibacteria bacterium]
MKRQLTNGMRVGQCMVRVRQCILFGVLLLCAFNAIAQTQLQLVDQLPPYNLTATLLNNGHFSVSTTYTGTSKTVIYSEDGSGNRPINYTSHIHVKVDNIVFQLPYELNPTTDAPPPPNPLKILRLFRDTVQRRPRINADMLALMPGNGDSIKITFTMEPVKRPSGGFIRFSVVTQNAGASSHSIGVLMLVDTKIGGNDQAPIATAFGYSGVEAQYTKGVGNGLPEFWLAIEGTPQAPGLAARGNLRAPELIEPNSFLFGNWVDDPLNNIAGLYRVLWKERIPSGLGYTDSAILLIWDELLMNRGARRLLAATEIGLVNSLVVTTGSGGGGGGGGGGGTLTVAGLGGCFVVDTVREDTCGKAGYSVYEPDTVQALYLVTNTGTTNLASVRAEVGTLPPGLVSVVAAPQVISNVLAINQTGVTVVSVGVLPRLRGTSYNVPISFVANTNDTIHSDVLCITVPGVLAKIKAADITTLPVCPGVKDTTVLPITLQGMRCLPLFSATVINPGAPPILRVVQPLPNLPAYGVGALRLEVSPITEGSFPIQVEVIVRDFETLTPGDTTFEQIIDTILVTVIGKNAEVKAVLPADTLDLGRICVGDSTFDDVLIQNIGGCDADLTSATFSVNPGGTFFIRNATLPITVGRGLRRTVPIGATSNVPGIVTGVLEITTLARPGTLLVPIKATFEIPTFTISMDTIDLDTICPDQNISRAVSLTNKTACVVRIDSVRSVGTDSVSVQPQSPFSVSPNGSVSINTGSVRGVQGAFLGTVRIYSAAGTTDIVVKGVVATRALQTDVSVDLGDVRVGQSTTKTFTISSVGSAPVRVDGLTISGLQAAEFTATPANGETFPLVLAAGATLDVVVRFTPADIETRRANLQVRTQAGICTTVEPVALTGRGILPILSVDRSSIALANVCLGAEIDTAFVLKNVGNAPLQVTALTSANVQLAVQNITLPFVLDSAASIRVPIKVSGNSIGNSTAEITITMDGEFLTQADTSVRVAVTANVCGTLTVDTSYAAVGTQHPVTIQLLADERTTLTTEQLNQTVAQYNAPIQFTISHNSSLLRFIASPSGLLGAATVTPTQSSVTVTATPPYSYSTPFLILRADVLLSSETRSPLTLSIQDFANGFYNIRTGNGLVRAEYCALDKRSVKPITAGILTWYDPESQLVHIYAQDACNATCSMVNITGSTLAQHALQLSASQTITLPLPLYARGWVGVRVESGGHFVQLTINN